MSAPAPLRAATVAGAILATAFIVLSAIVGGINAWRAHSASTYEAQAEQAQSEKATVDQQITDAKAALDAATVRKDAESWCDSITRESAASIRDSLKTYDSATQATKDAIHEQCPAKETLAQVHRSNKDADFTIAVGECTTDQVTTTVNGTLTLKDSSQIAIAVITSILVVLFAITTLMAAGIYSLKSKDLTETQEELSTVQQELQEAQEAAK